MNDLPGQAKDPDYPPAGFFDIWHAAALTCYKWVALPLALLFFSVGDGPTAWRLMRQGYEQTTGVVTEFSCGKSGRIEYTYYAGKYPYHNAGDNAGCHRYAPGETVPVYYSVRHPELAVAKGTPAGIFCLQMGGALFAALIMPLFGGLAAAMRSLRS